METEAVRNGQVVADQETSLVSWSKACTVIDYSLYQIRYPQALVLAAAALKSQAGCRLS